MKIVNWVFCLIFLLVIEIYAGETYFVDLTKVVNSDIEDDGISGNKKGGWSDEGINDMYIYPPLEFGKVNRYGYQFEILDPKKNDGKAVVMLKGQPSAQDKPAKVDIPIPVFIALTIDFDWLLAFAILVVIVTAD